MNNGMSRGAGSGSAGKKFTRTIEDFTCEHCGLKVNGDGYTNHCPECLYSKHVDINPGDRLNSCGGLMKPISVEIKSGDYILLHKCEKCGFEKKNKTSPKDNFENILKLVPSMP
jgi:rubrerythrin